MQPKDLSARDDKGNIWLQQNTIGTTKQQGHRPWKIEQRAHIET